LRLDKDNTVVFRKRDKRDTTERREDALRPSRYLGYDHDSLGMPLLSREAFEIAIRCFKRAIWLNPYEPAFKTHLALCLYKLNRYYEAYEYLKQVPENPENRRLMRIIEKAKATEKNIKIIVETL
jgi:tetratricopeptide (TPR) repeat protein